MTAAANLIRCDAIYIFIGGAAIEEKHGDMVIDKPVHVLRSHVRATDQAVQWIFQRRIQHCMAGFVVFNCEEDEAFLDTAQSVAQRIQDVW